MILKCSVKHQYTAAPILNVAGCSNLAAVLMDLILISYQSLLLLQLHS